VTTALTVGLEMPVLNQVSFEASATAGLALLRFTVDTVPTTFPNSVDTGSGFLLAATLGGNAGFIHHFNRLWALVIEARAGWLLPPVVLTVNFDKAGDSAWPAIGAAVAVRATY
jgi:hypothetical protein